MRPCFKFTAATKTKPAVLALDEEIGLWGTQAKDFRAQLDAVEGKELVVEINSVGGDVMAGLGIYNMLRAWAKDGKTVTTRVTGVAASIASVIALAGDKREMPKNTFAMVHQASTFAVGTADDMRDAADTLDKVDGSLRGIYMDRMGVDEAKAREIMAKDTWLTADESLSLGFATNLIDEIKATAKFDMARAELPEHVAAVFKAEDSPAESDEPATEEPVIEAEGVAEDTLADRVEALAVKAGLGDYAPLWAVSFTSIAEVEARISEAREIKALCAVAKKPEQADQFVKNGKTLAEARAALIDAMAKQDDATHTDNTIANTQATGKSASSGVSTASIWKKHKAAK